MSKSKTAQATAANQERPYSWQELRFISEYVEHGNATLAYLAAYPEAKRTSAGVSGTRWLKKARINKGVEAERSRLSQLFKFDREKAIKILLGMATARASDFCRVLKDPEALESYKHLEEKEYAIEATKKSWKNGNEVKLISGAERRAAINDLWDKLGLGKTGSAKDWTDGLDGLLGLIDQVQRDKPA